MVLKYLKMQKKTKKPLHCEECWSETWEDTWQLEITKCMSDYVLVPNETPNQKSKTQTQNTPLQNTREHQKKTPPQKANKKPPKKGENQVQHSIFKEFNI